MIMIATSTLSLLMQSSQRAVSASFEVSLLLRKLRFSTAALNMLSSRKMSSFDRELKENSKTIFLHSLSSVAPQTLIRNVLRREDDVLYINDAKYTLNRNLYLLGFGKAVLGMACEVIQLTRDHLQRGVLSIPAGLISPADDCLLRQGNIEVHEGSVNNLPDGTAMIAALETEQLVKKLDEKHLLLTLISGGGSALLPLPVSPILLREKSDLIQQLSESGASITELNTVRKKISVLKGGGLARLAAPAQTVSLILSDKGICFVAGGEPTVVVRGRGKGGRNQELALRMTIALNTIREQLEGTRVCFLSAGTDGIDGHTDAAGAFAYPHMIGEALEQNLHADNFIKCNDSSHWH
ncbi:hypothetical protein B566_EDAN018186 [Ephemera danica]|nr:hypothetical protein B566_EDAN018186 [Ephemera danica]